jgi:hypothetical protein
MEITTSRGYADLQAVMAMARQRNAALAAPTQSPVSTVNKTGSAQNMTRTARTVADVSVKSGKLADRFYGNTVKNQELSSIRVGSRFDAYA